MKLDLRKIANGYILTLDDTETFHDVPEAICGQMAEWIMNRCKELDAKPQGKTYGDFAKALMHHHELQKYQAEIAKMVMTPQVQVEPILDTVYDKTWKQTLLGDWSD